MRRFFTFFVLLLSAVSIVAQPAASQRKKVAVVLCGGGALGTSHIGVLKTLEQAGIPIDMVIGTSMGSIIGGLYAVGYDAADIETFINSIDWGYVMRDHISQLGRTIDDRDMLQAYLVSYQRYLNNQEDSLAGGLIRGTNIEQILRHYLRQPEDIDFKALPRAFACVASDLVTDSEVVLDHGSLACSIRASMSIPGLFAPVRIGQHILVDGGVKNDFPADVARHMGADIVIGVELDLGLDQRYTSMSDVLERAIGSDIHRRIHDNEQYCDLVIRVPVRGFSSGHFYHSAIKKLIQRGQDAAMAQMDSIIMLKQRAGIPADFRPEYSVIQLGDMDLSLAMTHLRSQDNRNSISTGLGLRYDTEDLIAALVGATYHYGDLVKKDVDFTLRLGRRSMAGLAWNIMPMPQRRLGLSYEIWHSDVNLYQRGRRSDNLRFVYQNATATLLTIDKPHMNMDMGVAWDYYHNYDVLSNMRSVSDFNRNEYYFNYHVRAQFDTEDSRYFTHRGVLAQARFAYYTDNFVQWKGHAGFSELAALWRMTLPVTTTTHVQPMAGCRLVWGDDVPATSMNMMGGNRRSAYFPQQMPFAGFGHCEVMDSKLLTAALKVQQRVFMQHYLILKGQVASQCSKLRHIFDGSPIWGLQAGYCYNSIVGPLGASISWSNRTRRLYPCIILGYDF